VRERGEIEQKRLRRRKGRKERGDAFPIKRWLFYIGEEERETKGRKQRDVFDSILLPLCKIRAFFLLLFDAYIKERKGL
jgi:hypothetical protein